MSNILSIATDGAPAMTARHKGFVVYLKKSVPNVITVHRSLSYVIKAIDKIRSNSLHDKLFRQLCVENDEDFYRLLLHTEVRWLSKGLCLDRFYKLFKSVLQFLENNGDALRVNLTNTENDIAYLTDLFKKFNETNL